MNEDLEQICARLRLEGYALSLDRHRDEWVCSLAEIEFGMTYWKCSESGKTALSAVLAAKAKMEGT